jgi:hypothetical protein
LLNLGGQNYNQNPLNLYDELPRSRAPSMARLQFEFLVDGLTGDVMECENK